MKVYNNTEFDENTYLVKLLKDKETIKKNYGVREARTLDLRITLFAMRPTR